MKKIAVGLSGGVDSAVAAYLLKEQGYEVIGVTCRVHNGSEKEVQDAACVAEYLQIPHIVTDVREAFEQNIVQYFVDSYQRGETPNPCIMCNPFIKWAALSETANREGADRIATGHYAGVNLCENGRYAISCAASAAKDQAYVLYGLTQEQLKRTIMPLCNYEKTEVRKIAEEAGIPVAHKADSMEICFLPEGTEYSDFIIQRTGKKPQAGNFVGEDGSILGKHRGVLYYTVGQRKGLGIAFGEPRYVKRLDVERNEVVLSDGNALLCKTVYAKDYRGMACEMPKDGERFVGKIRYSHRGEACTVFCEGDRIRCDFDTPQRAPAPGQALVLYKEDVVAGGAIIVG